MKHVEDFDGHKLDCPIDFQKRRYEDELQDQFTVVVGHQNAELILH